MHKTRVDLGSHVCAFVNFLTFLMQPHLLGMRKNHVDLGALKRSAVMVSCFVYFPCLSSAYLHDNLLQALFRGFRPLLDRVLVERFAPEVVGTRDWCV